MCHSSLPLYDIDPIVHFVVKAPSHCPSGYAETPTIARTLLGRTLAGGDFLEGIVWRGLPTDYARTKLSALAQSQTAPDDECQ
jgi:hypothetical protein